MHLLKELLSGIFVQEKDWRITLLQEWPTIIGALKTRLRVEKIEGTMLVLGVYEVHWMQELYLLSRVIVRTINSALDKPYITHVRFKLVETKKTTSIKPANVSYAGTIVKGHLTTAQENVLKSISDDQLKVVLISYLSKCTGKSYGC